MKRSVFLSLLLIFVLIGVAACTTPAPTPTPTPTPKPTLPAVLTMGTLPVGSTVNTQAVGMANVLNAHTGMSVKVVPQTAELVWVPQMLTKEVEVGMTTAPSMRQAYTGTFAFKDVTAKAGVKSFPVRLVAAGSPLRSALMVAGNSPIKKMEDLKGKRFPKYPDGTFFDVFSVARLANGGLTYADVTPVPFANSIETTRALIEGRVDTADIAFNAPVALEAIAKINSRYIPMNDSPERKAAFEKATEVGYIAPVKGGMFQGIPDTIPVIYFDSTFIASADLSDDVVYAIVKTFWDFNAELVKIPTLEEYTTGSFLTTKPNIPYHPGAIKFYKEKGVWTQTMEDFQKAILAAMPK